MQYPKTPNSDLLCDALLALKTREECYSFLEDLCTYGELDALSQRLAVAKMLTEGMVYHEITAATGASTATISRVNRCVDWGKGGYKTVLSRLGITKAEDENPSEKPD